MISALSMALAAWLTAAPATPEPGRFLDVTRFVDVTEGSGLDFVHDHGGTGERYLPETMGSGLCVLDYDGDGWMDLYLVQSGPVPGAEAPQTSSDPAGAATGTGSGNRLFRNLGGEQIAGLRFEDVTGPAGAGAQGAGGESRYGQGAACADLDGDGDTDIYLANFGPNVLLENRGDGTFREIPQAGGANDPSWGSSAVFFDPDRDGDLDLYVVNYLRFSVAAHRPCRHVQKDLSIYCHPDVYPPAPDRFYLNGGGPLDAGTFRESTVAAGRAVAGKGLGAVAADLDGDRWPDLYVTNDSTPNFLFRNLGAAAAGPLFVEDGLFAGVGYNQDGQTEAGMGVDAGDVNGDGRLDLFVTNLSLETNTLYLNRGEDFADATRTAGLHGPSLRVLGFGTELADVDNDGDLDLVVGNGDVLDNIERVNDGLRHAQPGQVFLNDGAGAFTALSAAGVGDFSRPRVARGLAAADFDNDGRLDLAVSYNGDRARIFRNQGPAGRWIGFTFPSEAPTPVGTRIEITAGGRTQAEELKAGSSYQSTGDPRLFFGLGSAETVETVRVLFPQGTERVYRNLAAERIHLLERPPTSSPTEPLREP